MVKTDIMDKYWASEHVDSFSEQYPTHSSLISRLAEKHKAVFNNPTELSKQLLHAGTAIKSSGMTDYAPANSFIDKKNSLKWKLHDLRAVSNLINNIKVEKDEKGNVIHPESYRKKLENIIKRNEITIHETVEGDTIQRAPMVLRDLAAVASLLLDEGNKQKIELTANAKKALEVTACFPDIYKCSHNRIQDNHVSATMMEFKERLNNPDNKISINTGNFINRELNKGLTKAGIYARI